MTETSRGIANKSQRINHIYGGRNHKTLITEPAYYAHCFKYVVRNPVAAGVCGNVEEYRYSTLSKKSSKMKTLMEPIGGGLSEFIPSSPQDLLHWLNEPTPKEIEVQCMRALKRSVFSFKPSRKTQKLVEKTCALHPRKVPGT